MGFIKNFKIMEINKQLFEDVLAGKLKGTFVLRNKVRVKTKFLMKSNFESLGFLYKLHYLDAISAEYTEYGKASNCAGSDFDIIDFIPDKDMKENELTIEIPNGKIVDWDESKKQNKIVLKDKQLTYKDVCKKLFSEHCYFIDKDGSVEHIFVCNELTTMDKNNATTEHQLECIIAKNQLANVAKYLNDGWKPVYNIQYPRLNKDVWTISCSLNGVLPKKVMENSAAFGAGIILFKSEKIAQQAIEILGEETVKLALEPLGI